MEHRRTVGGDLYAGVHGYTDTCVQGDRGVGEGGKECPTMLGGIAGWMLAGIHGDRATGTQVHRETRLEWVPGCGEKCHRWQPTTPRVTRVGM
jgi:hypothetical protein